MLSCSAWAESPTRPPFSLLLDSGRGLGSSEVRLHCVCPALHAPTPLWGHDASGEAGRVQVSGCSVCSGINTQRAWSVTHRVRETL